MVRQSGPFPIQGTIGTGIHVEVPERLPPMASQLSIPHYSHDMPTALNWTIGPYRITREIDRGQFGTVYEAADE